MRGSRGCGRRAGEFLRIPRSDACFGACLRPFAAEVCGLEYELIAYAEKLFQILCNRFEYGTSQRQHQRTFHLRLARRDFDNHHAVHFRHVVPENLLGCAKAATGRVQEVEEWLQVRLRLRPTLSSLPSASLAIRQRSQDFRELLRGDVLTSGLRVIRHWEVRNLVL